jgi:hypothetical protein
MLYYGLLPVRSMASAHYSHLHTIHSVLNSFQVLRSISSVTHAPESAMLPSRNERWAMMEEWSGDKLLIYGVTAIQSN